MVEAQEYVVGSISMKMAKHIVSDSREVNISKLT